MRAEPAPSKSEPSLDEILASIRRIISDDEPVSAASGLAMRHADEEAEDVLLLTRRFSMSDDGGPHAGSEEIPLHLTRRANEDASSEPPPAQPLQNFASYLEPMGAPPAGPVAAAFPAAVREPEEPVMSDETREVTAAAFDRLQNVARADRAVPSILMPAPGRTLEDVIRELMRPLLKEWLDENLPEIVRSRVDEEVERIVRSRVR